MAHCSLMRCCCSSSTPQAVPREEGNCCDACAPGLRCDTGLCITPASCSFTALHFDYDGLLNKRAGFEQQVFYDLKQFLETNKTPVPPQLARHEAARVKPGSVDGRPKRDTIQYAKH